MEPIEIEKVQHLLESFINKDVYIHLETTNGAYASHFNDKAYNVGAYVRNAQVNFSQAKIVGDGKTFSRRPQTRNGMGLRRGFDGVDTASG